MFKKISSIFTGDQHKRTIGKMVAVVDAINALEPSFEALSTEALRAKTDEFRARPSNSERVNALLTGV